MIRPRFRFSMRFALFAFLMAAGSRELYGQDSAKTILAETPLVKPKKILMLPTCYRISISEDDAKAIFVGVDGTVRTWNLKEDCEIKTFAKGASFHCLAASGDFSSVLFSDTKGNAHLLTNDGKQEKLLQCHSVHGGASVLAASGKYAIVSGGDRAFVDRVVCTVKFWDIEKNKISHLFGSFQSFVSSIAFVDVDEKYVVTVGGHRSDKPVECAVRVWNTKNGKLAFELFGHSDTIKHVASTGRGSQLITGSSDGTVRLWDVKERKQILQLSLDEGVWCVAISQDGTKCLAGAGKTAYLFDLESKKSMIRFSHLGPVTNVGFLSNGIDMYSVSVDGTMAIWSRN